MPPALEKPLPPGKANPAAAGRSGSRQKGNGTPSKGAQKHQTGAGHPKGRRSASARAKKEHIPVH
ncbi:hypothetical protein B6A10_07130 [Flavobacterium sp. L1I52]|uniref:Uncharacterized protein n=1 Tax=Flavobacterium pokkalii TaxID=1940408 RepID=A0ABR7UQ31_9FLAO|nr:hypothetical protein [Flavobacterium pokkalii]